MYVLSKGTLQWSALRWGLVLAMLGTVSVVEAKPRSRSKSKPAAKKSTPTAKSAPIKGKSSSEPAAPVEVESFRLKVEYGPDGVAANTVDLTLEAAVRSALAYSPSMKRSALDTRIAQLAIGRLQAGFSPTLSLEGRGGFQRRYNEFAGRDNSPFSNVTDASVNAELTGLTTFGGRYTLRSEAGWLSQPNEFFATLSPRYSSLVAGRWVQPLMRDSGKKANLALVKRERLTVELREAQERELLLSGALKVVSSYWALVLRREELKIIETNIEAARTLEQVVIRRVRAGEDAKSALVQAQAAVAERVQALEIGRVAVADAERALLGDSYLHETGILKLTDVPVPVDRHNDESPAISLAKEIEVALKNRPEVARMKREVRLASIDLDIAKNSKKIRLDVYAEAGLLGLSGRSKFDANVPANEQPPSALIGGPGSTVLNMPRAPFFEVGIQMQLPFNNTNAKNAVEQAKIRIKRAQTQDVETRVKLDVRNAVQRVRIATASLLAAKESLRLAEENLGAQTRRYEGGGATLFDVTRSQDDLSRAQAQVALSRGQLAISQAVLESARGTLLSSFGVDVNVAK